MDRRKQIILKSYVLRLSAFFTSFLYMVIILTEFSQGIRQFPHYSDSRKIIIQTRESKEDKLMEKSYTIIAGCGRLGASIAGKLSEQKKML